jgi:hypothetical protein
VKKVHAPHTNPAQLALKNARALKRKILDQVAERDYEAAAGTERDLCHEVLKEIVAGNENSKTLARIALSITRMDFPRY